MFEPTQFYKCLADQTRLTILLLIQQEVELCVCELTCAINEIQPKISRHLALLKKQNLLTDRKQGQWVYYQINPQAPDWAKQVLSITLNNNKHLLQNNLTNLQQMGDRPSRQVNCC